MINILILDEHPLFIEGLTNCLKTLPRVGQIVECVNYEQVKERLKTGFVPNLIFLEPHIGSKFEDGFSISKKIATAHPDVFIAMLSRLNSEHLVLKAREHGARAYLDKRHSSCQLHHFWSDFVSGHIKKYYVNVSKPNRTGAPTEEFEARYALSKRQLEVMDLILAGKRAKDVCQDLKISYETFRSHRTVIFKKLGCTNVVELTRFASTRIAC
jgi:DNA-binding NarL/FixJ family response regulator